jgi:hypothetical protein
MLDPEYLAQLPEAILKLWRQAEVSILKDMARRISTYDYYIPAADHQHERLLAAGRTNREILTTLSGLTRRSEQELRDMMVEAGSRCLRGDIAVYTAAGRKPPRLSDSKALQAILNAGYRATVQTMRNLTRTTAQTATGQFERALDLAWLQVSSGAFDAESAVRSAIKSLAARGIEAIVYPSGHADTAETAVRRAVLTGVNQTAAQLQEELADELDCDLVEVSAHAGARPEHAVWQGKIYSRSGKSDKYPDFRSATGYGTGAGLCGWNCRHTFGPYIEGSPRIWTDEKLAELNAPKYEYQGEKYTEYEARQKEKYFDRQIHRWQREAEAMKAAGQDPAEARAKVRAWTARENDFLSNRITLGIANPNNGGIIETEMFHKSDSPERPFKPVSERRFNELTIAVRKQGAKVIRGTEEVERHLAYNNASASTMGSTLMFRSDACISEVIEETYHFDQNRRGLNDDKPAKLRTILNEIDAREYMLNNARKFGIPQNECEHLSNQLASYREQLEQWEEG